MSKKKPEKLRAVDEAALLGHWAKFYKLQRKSCRSIMTQAKRTIATLEAMEALHPETDYSEEKKMLADAWDRAKALETVSVTALEQLKKEEGKA
jgi:hypothetical protein